ncbi:UNVERIFIED_CONTAM: hypothetical protein FKN15_077182 [Acipenser sinensis]
MGSRPTKARRSSSLQSSSTNQQTASTPQQNNMTLPCTTDSYSLSVRRSNSSSWESIKHYRINRLGNGWFYISARLTFPSLQHMVDYYTESGEGLCCTLNEPCYIQGSNNVPVQNIPEPIIVRKPTLNWKDVDSSMLFGTDKEGTEDSLVSEGLREAINSYLYMTEERGSDQGSCSNSWKTC